jgi:hypothetical protein
MRSQCQVYLSFALHDEGLREDGSADGPSRAELWEKVAEPLRAGLCELGSELELRDAGQVDARFSSLVSAPVLSEALRLGMSWVGMAPERSAELTGPVGSLRLFPPRRCQDEEPDMDRLADWLTANTARPWPSAPSLGRAR